MGDADQIAGHIGCALYLIGTFLSTIVFNVPLNNELASVNGKSAAAPETWSRYVRRWTLWNHAVPALAAAIALALAVAQLHLRSAGRTPPRVANPGPAPFLSP